MGAPLRDVREGGRVGLALDKSRTLHLYIAGNHVGVVTRVVADPCYVMIDLNLNWRKVGTWMSVEAVADRISLVISGLICLSKIRRRKKRKKNQYFTT